MLDTIRHQHFPAEIIPNITAKAVDSKTIGQVWSQISNRVFSSLTQLGNYATPKERHHRASLLREVASQMHHEYIVFYNEQNQPIGWSTGNMIEESTFFMSYSGVLPEYQRQGIYTAFLKHLLTYLHELGYERVTSNHMANNRPVLIAKLKAGFYITGLTLDERYGAQATLTYFFYEDRRRGFAQTYSLEQYGGVPEYF